MVVWNHEKLSPANIEWESMIPMPQTPEEGTPTVEELAARIAALEAVVAEIQQAVFREPPQMLED